MSRHILTLTRANRDKALLGVARAPDGWTLELRAPKRSDAQNAALWGLIGQIQKQRPVHNGMRMTPDLWKSVFLQALGVETVMVPTLDADGFFALGRRSSQLTKGEFADLLTLMLAWCSREGIAVEHFDDAEAA